MQSKSPKRAVFSAIGSVVLLAGAAQGAGVPGQGTWETTLLGRDINGHAVDASSVDALFLYDTTLDITWLRDANYAETSGYDSNGNMYWSSANTWANTLKVGNFSGWRLPTLKPVNGSAFQYVFSNNGSTDAGYAKTGTGWGVANEMGHLYYVTLGNKGQSAPNDADPGSRVWQPGWGLTNTGSFQNMQHMAYWSGQEYAVISGFWAWTLDFERGAQYIHSESQTFPALAVRPGDIALVPEPQTYVLLMLGLAGLAVARRRPY